MVDGPTVTPIRLDDDAFEGRNNSYLLDGAVPTLVDTGVATPPTRAQLESGLEEAGLALADVEQVLLTHWHADHVGLAGAVQEAGGATVRVHEADAALVAGEDDAWEALHRLYEDRFEAWGMPAEERREVEQALEVMDALTGDPPSVTSFEAGARVEAGDGHLEVVHLPGHAAGACGFAAGGTLFAGDALLPHYTPNVGGADVRVDRALATYLDSLARVAAAGYDRAWPGHRGRIDDPAGRAAEIVAHHRERAGRVLQVLDEHGPADAWTVSAHLFGDLSGIHVLHGPGEAAAHLDHLARAGLVTGGPDYRLLEAGPVDPLFPDIDGVPAVEPEAEPFGPGEDG